MPTITRTITVRLDPELVALLTEIRDRLPEREPLPDFVERRPDRDGFNLRHWKPGAHTAGADCPCGPEKVPHESTPARPELESCDAWQHDPETGECEVCGPSAPAPADDLPGEPVEPGDLRAGDRVAFTFKQERITCNLVSSYDDTILRSDAPDSDGYYPSIVYRGEWFTGISDVRLIERAPREDEALDEALARVIFGDAYGSHEGLRQAQLDVARAAREHIEVEGERAAKGEQSR